MDFDGLTNEEELKLGTNPVVANIPEMGEVYTQEIKLGFKGRRLLADELKFYGLKSTYPENYYKKVINKEIIKAHYEFIKKNQVDLAQTNSRFFSDSGTVYVWNYNDYFLTKEDVESVRPEGEKAGLFSVAGLYALSNTKNVTSIENIKVEGYSIDSIKKKTSLGVGFLLGQNEDAAIVDPASGQGRTEKLRLNLSSINTGVVQKIINTKQNIAVEVKDFDYSINGKQFKYSQIKDNVENQTAKVVIAGRFEDVKTFNVAPGVSIRDFLLIDSHVNGRGGQVTTMCLTDICFEDEVLKDGTDLDSLNGREQLRKYRWDILNKDKTIDSKLEKGDVVIISRSEAIELLGSQNHKTMIFEDIIGRDEVEISGLGYGDRLDFEIKTSQVRPVQKKYEDTLKCSCEVKKPCDFGSFCGWERQSELDCRGKFAKVEMEKENRIKALIEIVTAKRAYKYGDFSFFEGGRGFDFSSNKTHTLMKLEMEDLDEGRKIVIRPSKEGNEDVEIEVGLLELLEEEGRRNCLAIDASKETVRKPVTTTTDVKIVKYGSK
ncbi:MAG: hypothetical protein EP326_09265 [Deltaproteobacteria bacterium]|nr:MAG: hypothetical protein EP326_09265 [Deltaproteobacteria bacterium]